jgi:hypothetical protein
MFFTPNVLSGRMIQRVLFDECHFQPTGIVNAALNEVEFRGCEFERLEIEPDQKLSGCTFSNCKIESLIVIPEEPTFDPILIAHMLSTLGAITVDGQKAKAEKIEVVRNDERLRQFERFLRIFLKNTSIGEAVIRVRLGKSSVIFFDQVLPVLLEEKILEEVPWLGQGMQHRYKLKRQMSELQFAMEQANGSFDKFISAIKHHNHMQI